jgi:hypothetical protein
MVPAESEEAALLPRTFGFAFVGPSGRTRKVSHPPGSAAASGPRSCVRVTEDQMADVSDAQTLDAFAAIHPSHDEDPSRPAIPSYPRRT